MMYAPLPLTPRAICMRVVILRSPGSKSKPYCQMGRHDWSALGSGMNSNVYALAVDASGNLYAGGSFTTAGGVRQTALPNGTARLVCPGLGDEVRLLFIALAFDASGNLYAGGNFTTAGGVSANCIAKWDGTSWSALGSGMSDGCVTPLLLTPRAICMRGVLLRPPGG